MRLRTAIFAFGAIITLVFFINFCGLIYGCGCHSLWNGADELCNIHAPQARHCPWCVIGLAGDFFVLCWIWSVQAFFAFGFERFTWPVRLACTLLAFPLAAAVAALMVGYKTQYWN